jgi:hypothetical protein
VRLAHTGLRFDEIIASPDVAERVERYRAH